MRRWLLSALAAALAIVDLAIWDSPMAFEE